MVIGLKGVQFSLQSYEWLTKSDDSVAGVWFVSSRVWLPNELDDTKFCYQLIITETKFVIYKTLFWIKTQEIPRFCFASSEKSPFKRARDSAYCPVT